MTLRRATRVTMVVLAGMTIGTLVAVRPSPVSAHASLWSSEPAANTVADTAPTAITLRFSEPVDVVPDGIELVDADGRPVRLGDVARSEGGRVLSAPIVESLADGTWVVVWRALSADSHPIRGAFAFSIGVALTTDDAVLETILLGDPERDGSPWLQLGRAASYLGIALLAGVLMVTWWCVPVLVEARRTGVVLWASAYLAVGGTIAMIAAQAWQLTGSAFAWPSWQTVVSSQSGRWWMARLFTLAAVPGIVMARGLLGRSRIAMGTVAAVWIALLAIVAAGGHSVTGRLTAMGFAATLVHLGAVAVWTGGIAVIAAAPSGERWPIAARFSPLALGSVVVLGVSGTVNALRQGVLPGLVDTAYGRWLIVKVVLVAGIVLAATASRRLARIRPAGTTALADPAVPAAGDASATTGISTGDRRGASGSAVPVRLRRAVIVELAGVVTVFAVTGALVSSSPPIVAAGDADGPVSVSVVEGGVDTQIVVDPAVTGGTTMHVVLTSIDPDLARPDEITVTARHEAADIGPIDIATIPAGPQHVIAPNATFPVAGDWTITVTARYGEFDQQKFVAEVTIR